MTHAAYFTYCKVTPSYQGFTDAFVSFPTMKLLYIYIYTLFFVFFLQTPPHTRALGMRARELHTKEYTFRASDSKHSNVIIKNVLVE